MQILVAKFTSNNVTPSCRLDSMALLCLWQCFFFQIPLVKQEDLECGVCTSGSSCERGWGATVDPAALNVELGPRQPGVNFRFFCTFSIICLQKGDALDDEQRRELPPELLRLLRLQRQPLSCLPLLDNWERHLWPFCRPSAGCRNPSIDITKQLSPDVEDLNWPSSDHHLTPILHWPRWSWWLR